MFTKNRIISYIVAFILTIFMLMTITMVDLNFTVFSKKNCMKKAESANYQSRVYDIIMESCEEDTKRTGFDSVILENVITKQDVESDCNHTIGAIYGEWEPGIETGKLRSTLNANIDAFIEKSGYGGVDEETRADINVYEDTIEDIYIKTIEYSKEDIKSIATNIKKIRMISIAIVIISILVVGVLGYITYRKNAPGVGVAMMATGAILIAAKIVSETSAAITNIFLLNIALSDVISAIINQAFNVMLIVGIFLCVAGLIWTIIFEIKKSYTKVLLIEEHSQVIR